MVWLRNPATQSFASNETSIVDDLIIESVRGFQASPGDEGVELEVVADEASFESDDTLLHEDPLGFSPYNSDILRLKRELVSPYPGEEVVVPSPSPRDVKPVLRGRGGVATAGEVAAGPEEFSNADELLGPSHQLHMLEAGETDADLDVDDDDEAAMNVCEDCEKNFATALLLLKHKCCRAFKCPTCAWKGQSERALRTHVESAHRVRVPGPVRHRCPDCGVTFSKRCGLISHSRVHSRAHAAPAVHARAEAKVAVLAVVQAKEERAAQGRGGEPTVPELCERCGCSYLSRQRMRRHRAQCRGPQVRRDVKPTPDDKSLVKMAVAGRYGKQSRDNDGKGDAGEEEVAEDKKDIKGRVKPFYCKWCLESFWYRRCMLTHIERNHLARHPFKCPTCAASFPTIYSLSKHKKVHSLPRAFTCALCHRMFQEREQLIAHLQEHLDPKKASAAGMAGMSGVTAISIKKEIGEDRKRRS